jgi:hypothetical protein
MGAALSAAPLGIATIATPAIGNACAPGEVMRPGGACATECDRGQINRNSECVDALAALNQAIDPAKTPEENLVNLQSLPPMELGGTPLIETSPLVEVPVDLAIGLPGIGLPGIGVNLWPDLSTLPSPQPPDLTALAVPALALPAIGAPQLPPPPPFVLPPPPALPPPPSFPRPQLCGPEITPFFRPCL